MMLSPVLWMLEMDDDQQLYEQARLIVQRLERIPVDSIWSRRSSGHRGALLRWIEQMDLVEGNLELQPDQKAQLNLLVHTGYRMLERAAQERMR